LEWAIPRLSSWIGGWDKASCLIHEKDGEIIACVVYNNWKPLDSAEISVAAAHGERWLTRPFLYNVFYNPFVEWQMRRVWSCIDADNQQSIRLCAHLGFSQEGRIRQGAGPKTDILLYGMLKDECRFLEGRYLGQQRIGAEGGRPEGRSCGANSV
jgi:RimJ/RimL family protein N-acetyltransferase